MRQRIDFNFSQLGFRWAHYLLPVTVYVDCTEYRLIGSISLTPFVKPICKLDLFLAFTATETQYEAYERELLYMSTERKTD